jgi:hypothetical protein
MNMIEIEEIYDSIKVGMLAYDLEELKQSIKNAGGPHDSNEPRFVVYELYNYTDNRSIRHNPHFADQQKLVSGIGKCLLRKLAEKARDAGHDHIYVTGAKRQAWEFYKGMGFKPVGTNVLNWFAKTADLLRKTEGAQIVVRTMQGQSNAIRAPSSLFALALSKLARTPGEKPGDDPKDSRTLEGKTIKW